MKWSEFKFAAAQMKSVLFQDPFCLNNDIERRLQHSGIQSISGRFGKVEAWWQFWIKRQAVRCLDSASKDH